jgi:hypothetical protein
LTNVVLLSSCPLRGGNHCRALVLLRICVAQAEDVIDPPLIPDDGPSIERAQHLPAGAARLDDAGTSEDSEVPRDQRLAHAKLRAQLRDRDLLVLGEILGDVKALAIRQGTKEKREILHKPIFVR